MNNVNGQKTLSLTILEINEPTRRKLATIAIEAVFVATVVFVSTHLKDIPIWMLPLLALATMRMAHTVSYNEVMEWLREPFCYVEADSCGAGADVKPKGNGVQYVIGSLLACCICSGTWSALVLVALYFLVPALGTTLIYVLGLAGASELLHYLKEMWEWRGREARVVSGKIAPDKE